MMKSRHLIISMILTIGLITESALSQQWSPEISVERPGQAMTSTPDFDIDPVTGHLHIVTMLDPKGVLYTEMDNDGTILKQSTIPYASEDEAIGGGYFGASVSVDPLGRPHVVYRYLAVKSTKEFNSYYTYWNGTLWTTPVLLSERIVRGYMVRVDVDGNGKTHIARSSASQDPDDPTGNLLVGPVKYFRFTNGIKDQEKDDITRYSADDRLDIDASYPNQVHLILSCSDYQPPGPVWYWRSFNNGESWVSTEIRSPNATGQNGSSDIFVDASGKVHIMYGSEKDLQLGGATSVRYVRFENNVHIRDVVVSEAGEIPARTHSPQGMGSVAASEDGSIVMVAYGEGFGLRLWVRRSDNGGQTFGEPFEIAPQSIGAEGKNKHLIRAYKSNFYVVYPTPTGVKLRYLKLTVNQPPVAHAGGPYQANEGTAITFNGAGSTDGDGSIVKYEWDFQNDGTYDQTTTSATLSHTISDDFNGTVKLRVTDNENATATATQTLVVANVAPTAEAGGPYSGVINSPIQLTGSSTDPGTDTPTYSWDLNNDTIFETQGQSPQATFTTGGTHVVTLKVTDGDGGQATDQANVVLSNNPPVVSQIPNQTITEGGSFTTISLDNYVTDSDNSDSQITWSVTGATNLQVTITTRVATITPKDAEWNGSETITFVATDPGGLSDDCQTTFTITAVNDDPVVSQIPNQTIAEGSSFTAISLDNYVTDPDNADNQITWTATGQAQLTVTITNRVATIQTP
ncbi:MAG: PKD domain-containing protein, partial [Candidatus Zhuqueibacterota bacterium]